MSKELEESVVEVLESYLNQIATELVLAKEGSDDGLLPVYALLSHLDEEDECNTELLEESIKNIKSALDQLLEETRPFDQKTLFNANAFSKWFEKYINAQKFGEEFDQIFECEAIGDDEARARNAGTSAPFEEIDDALLVLNLEGDREILEEFHTEGGEHLEEVEAALLVLEKNFRDEESLKSIYRAFHTIKGVAGFLHLMPVERLSHEVELLLDLATKGSIRIGSRAITLILEAKDILEKFLAQIGLALKKGVLPEEIIPVSNLIQLVKEEAERAINELKLEGGEEEQAKNLQKVVGHHTSFIRVDTNKLENLMNMVGELVIAQSQVTECAQRLGLDDSLFQKNMTQLFRVTKELQYTSMALRMTPIRSVFQKLSRQVRDLVQQLDKKVELSISGEETELDRNVVEKIGDPLVHMVRNAIDHGIETEEDRIASGKDKVGRLSLKAYYKGSHIVIEIADDGRGMDPVNILKKAESRGLAFSDQDYEDKDIFQFIFLPGFSTADTVSEVSGRGIGMDVVKKNIEDLRGTVEIESVVGRGTTFKIRLPLTTAIIDGLVIRVGEEKFIIPATMVKIVLRPQDEQLQFIQGGREVLNFREEVIPIKRLHERFGISGAAERLQDGAVVVIETLSEPYGIFVDEVLTKQEVVIKSVGALREENPDISGGAILGDGNAVLILDPNAIAD